MNSEQKKPVRDQILDAIRVGQVHMRPRWHFVLRTLLMAIGVLLIFLTLLYLASFVFFTLRQTGVWFVPVFGSRGWFEFLVSLPWLLILLSLIFIAILEVLVRRYAFAYRRPLLYSAIGIIAIVVVGGFAVARTPFHRSLFRFAEENEVPFARDFYRGYEFQRMRNVHVGSVDATTSDGFVLKNPLEESIRIIITPNTRLPLGMGFREGDAVVVFGQGTDDVITAFGIQKVDEDFRPHMPMMGGHMQPYR